MPFSRAELEPRPEPGDEETMSKLRSIRDMALQMSRAVMSENREEICSIINEGWKIKAAGLDNDSIQCKFRYNTDTGFPWQIIGGAVFNTTIDRGIMIRYLDDGGTLEISSRDFLKRSPVIRACARLCMEFR